MSEEEFEKLIEAMARAICRTYGDDPDSWSDVPDGKGSYTCVDRWTDWVPEARAAAEAIGLKPGMVVVPAEPTAGMLVEAHRKCQYAQMLVYGDYEAVYKAMLAARPQPASAGDAA